METARKERLGVPRVTLGPGRSFELVLSRYQLNARIRWAFDLLRGDERRDAPLIVVDHGWHRFVAWHWVAMLLFIMNAGWIIALVYSGPFTAHDWKTAFVVLVVNASIGFLGYMLWAMGRRLELEDGRYRMYGLQLLGAYLLDEGDIQDLQLTVRAVSVLKVGRDQRLWALCIEGEKWRIMLRSCPSQQTDESAFKQECAHALPDALRGLVIESDEPLQVISKWG